MKVGSFAPLPPARTGVADYAATLLSALRRHGDIEPNASDADVSLYHIGNNQLHREIYERAIRIPGVVVLHDAVLNHFFLGTLDRDRYIDEFVYNYGEWTRGLAEMLWANRARSAADPRYFEYPMLKRLTCAARAVIVHNPAASRLVRSHNPEAKVVQIPHFFLPPPLLDPVDTLRFRADLELGPRTLLAGVFGHLRETKRLPVILRALEQAWRIGADVKLLVQGEFASRDLEQSLACQIDGNPRIVRAGYLQESEFWKWAAATDVCVNLRYPTAAETSGIAIRMMGAGKTVIFSSGEELDFPETACLRIDRGPAEEQALADYLRWLAADREAVEAIGTRAAEYVRREHSLEKVSAQYWKVLSSL
jgi:glycosyltransferase involved in cell wall biosynthesis